MQYLLLVYTDAELMDKLPAEEVIMHFTVQNLADMVARRAAAKEAA